MSEKPLAKTDSSKITAYSPRIPQQGDPDYWPAPWTSQYGHIMPEKDPFLGAPQQPKAGSGFKTLAIWLAVALAVFACVAIFILLPDGSETNRPEGEKVFDQFVRAAGQGDIEGAYRLISPALQSSYLTRDLLNAQLIQPARPLLAKYQSLTTSDKSYNDETDNNNAVLVLSGQMKYSDGKVGTFQVNLEKVDGNWYIYNYRIDKPYN